ncbi:hypothetical protein AWN76_015960 [Rhodothermaceae bacterium RA]|nr:hypothetical protein AWN76_015960 [Rhodothermaceae bacterium RA]
MDAPPPEPPADREDEDEPTIAGPFAGAEMPRAWFTGLSWEDEEERSWDDEDATAEDAFAPLAGADPVEADPVEADPVEADPVEADPVEADPVEADPVEADPVEADAVEADAVEADPVEADRAAGPSPEERVADFEDLDRLIEELEQARIVPRPDIDAIPTPDLEDEIDDMVSETLARIYAAQQQFDEAARVYDALARQQPDRAAEFREQAARMRARHQT